MGLFGGNKEEKAPKETKAEKFLRKRGLEGLETDVSTQINAIATDLTGNGMGKTGIALSFAKMEEQMKVTYLSALVEQNWILIKQNDEILKELRKK